MVLTKKHVAQAVKEVKQPFYVAAGKKLVTWIGLITTSLSAACLTLSLEWMDAHLPGLKTACSISVFAGAIITAFGKGLADRRPDTRV